MTLHQTVAQPRFQPEILAWLGVILFSLAAGVGLASQPVLLFAALAGMAFMLVAFHRPALFVALWAMSFFVPYAIGGNALLKAGFATALVVGAIRLCADGRAAIDVLRRHRGIVIATSLLLSWILLSVLWAPNVGAAIAEVGPWLLTIVVFVSVLAAFDHEQAIVAVVGVWFAGAALSALTAILNTPVVSTATVDLAAASGRAGGGAGDPNILAAGLVAGVVLAVGLWAVTSSIVARLALVGLGACALVALAGTASRGAVVAVAVAAIAAVGVSGNRLRTAAGIAASVGVGLLVWSRLSPVSWARVSDFGGGGTGRTELWRAAAYVWGEQRFAGVGIGNLVVVEPAVALDIGPLAYGDLIAERPLVAHNVYLQFLSELGLVGFVLYAAVVLISLRAALSASRIFAGIGRVDLATLSRAVYVAVISLFGAALFLSMGREYRLWVLLAAGPLLERLAKRLAADETERATDPRPTLQGA